MQIVERQPHTSPSPIGHDGASKIYFSDFFGVSKSALAKYGAFNISLVADLPLFIDPFLLFNSRKKRYKGLHEDMIRYLRFLRDKSVSGPVSEGLLAAWFCFSEIKQNWLGFSRTGNSGSGLGMDFARALRANLNTVFSSFGSENVTRSSHLEKLCLIRSGVGRDNISDFTTNLIKAFLLEYSQEFASRFLKPCSRRQFAIARAVFNYETESWETRAYDLPAFQNDFIILTPRDLLTRDETWINRPDMIHSFEVISAALPNVALRDQVNHYFRQQLSRKPKDQEVLEAKARTFEKYPELIEHYIKAKEDNGEAATSESLQRVRESEEIYIFQIRRLCDLLQRESPFYQVAGLSYKEAHDRITYLKDVIENKDGYRLLYRNSQPIAREEDLQIMYRLTWRGSISDINREVNNGRGPVDFKASVGARESTVIEFKLASNTQLRRNLEKQAEIYQKASNARRCIKVVIFFTAEQGEKTKKILKDLSIDTSPDVILIDARNDNKPSGSKA